MDRNTRRQTLDVLARLNEIEAKEYGDPETLTRIAQYELAYRMQIAVPEVMDITRESNATLALYGREAGRGFVRQQLSAGPPARGTRRALRATLRLGLGTCTARARTTTSLRACPKKLPGCGPAAAALIKDLKQRGMLDETLVVWGGRIWPHAVERGAQRQQVPGSATITRTASPSGWLVAASKAASTMARPTSSAISWSRTR